MTAAGAAPAAAPPAPRTGIARAGPAKLARDTWLVFGRQMLLVWRTPIWIIFGLAQPVTYLLLFAPILKLALAAQGVTDYNGAYRVYVPGLLTVMAIFGGMYTGFGLLTEIRSGIIERARVTPVSRPALLLGRALRDVTTLLIQATIIVLLAAAIPHGLSVGLGDVLLAYLILVLLQLMSVSLSYGVTMRVRNEGALSPLLNAVGSPVMLLAGVLLPLSLAPLWMVRVARWNPFYWATNGMRALFNGHPGDTAVWVSLVVVPVLAALAMTWSVRLFARTAQ
jgi:ABC-2 type transport system permease protein